MHASFTLMLDALLMFLPPDGVRQDALGLGAELAIEASRQRHAGEHDLAIRLAEAAARVFDSWSSMTHACIALADSERRHREAQVSTTSGDTHAI